MSLSISKLLDLNGNGERDKYIGSDPSFPNRNPNNKMVRPMNEKNQGYDPYEYDQFNQIMKQSRQAEYNLSSLKMDIKSKAPNPFDLDSRVPRPFKTGGLEGSLDPAQSRRRIDPNHAPPYDFNFGAESQKFGLPQSTHNSSNNESLIRMAHSNYLKSLNKYNVPNVV